MQERTHGDFVAELERQRDAIQAALASFDESGKPVALDQSAQGRVSRIDAITQQQMARAGRTHLGIQLKRIDAALARAASGSYGTCCRCRAAIAPARLAADPAVPFCLDCTEEIAATRDTRDLPHR